MSNLMKGLMDELKRNRELLKEYQSIGLEGQMGSAILTRDIAFAEKAIEEGDVVKMLQAYNDLKNTE